MPEKNDKSLGSPVGSDSETEVRCGKWRVGSHVPINVYDGDRPVCQCHTVEDAYRIVAAVNAAPTSSASPLLYCDVYVLRLNSQHLRREGLQLPKRRREKSMSLQPYQSYLELPGWDRRSPGALCR